jgi:hypothetical protein
MQGALTIAIEAPEDDQLLFKLVSQEDRQLNMLKKVWVQATIRALMPTVNQMVEQALAQSRLFPVARVVNPAFASDPEGRLLYLFQVPVSTFPPENGPQVAPQQQAPAPGPVDPAPANQNPAMTQAEIDALIGLSDGGTQEREPHGQEPKTGLVPRQNSLSVSCGGRTWRTRSGSPVTRLRKSPGD